MSSKSKEIPYVENPWFTQGDWKEQKKMMKRAHTLIHISTAAAVLSAIMAITAVMTK